MRDFLVRSLRIRDQWHLRVKSVVAELMFHERNNRDSAHKLSIT
jgi:hypothetical protein